MNVYCTATTIFTYLEKIFMKNGVMHNGRCDRKLIGGEPKVKVAENIIGESLPVGALNLKKGHTPSCEVRYDSCICRGQNNYLLFPNGNQALPRYKGLSPERRASESHERGNDYRQQTE